MKQLFYRLSLTTILFSFLGCSAFMDGYTSGKARNQYNLVTGVEGNLGDTRLKYIKAYCIQSDITKFLELKNNYIGLPDLIYEYQSESKSRGTQLFYVKIDSVYVFEQQDKKCLNSTLKEARKINEYEKSVYKKLIQTNR